jgi:hypothetical protein
MTTYIILAISLAANVLLLWYLSKLLKKFMYISQSLSDLYLTTKAFAVFVKNLYSMDSYHGEPMIQELVSRIREVNVEMETFRDVFQYTIDQEMDEELEEAANAEEEEQEKLLLYAGTRRRNS